MTAVAIVREELEPGIARFRAMARNHDDLNSIGRTAGEALDALTAQLDDQDAATLVIVQEMRPDALFTETQINRLRELVQKSNANQLTPQEQADLDALIEAELVASAKRVATLADDLGR